MKIPSQPTNKKSIRTCHKLVLSKIIGDCSHKNWLLGTCQILFIELNVILTWDQVLVSVLGQNSVNAPEIAMQIILRVYLWFLLTGERINDYLAFSSLWGLCMFPFQLPCCFLVAVTNCFVGIENPPSLLSRIRLLFWMLDIQTKQSFYRNKAI